MFDDTITRFIWDGNVPLHEWSYDIASRPIAVLDEFGILTYNKEEPTENVITWIFDQGSFKPAAKLVNGETYSIINDYLGTPTQAFDSSGKKVWERELYSYGKVKKETGEKNFIPFLYQGQYKDVETGLCYNRFRYYFIHEGMYVGQQDPIGLSGNNATPYSYVSDSNIFIDELGLSECATLSALARETHNLAGNHPKAISQTTVSIVEAEVKGIKQLFASGSGGYLRPAQVENLIKNGIPAENIFSGAAFSKGFTQLENHAERVILRNLPEGASVTRWGISWASKQKNMPCSVCEPFVREAGGIFD